MKKLLNKLKMLISEHKKLLLLLGGFIIVIFYLVMQFKPLTEEQKTEKVYAKLEGLGPNEAMKKLNELLKFNKTELDDGWFRSFKIEKTGETRDNEGMLLYFTFPEGGRSNDSVPFCVRTLYGNANEAEVYRNELMEFKNNQWAPGPFLSNSADYLSIPYFRKVGSRWVSWSQVSRGNLESMQIISRSGQIERHAIQEEKDKEYYWKKPTSAGMSSRYFLKWENMVDPEDRYKTVTAQKISYCSFDDIKPGNEAITLKQFTLETGCYTVDFANDTIVGTDGTVVRMFIISSDNEKVKAKLVKEYSLPAEIYSTYSSLKFHQFGGGFALDISGTIFCSKEGELKQIKSIKDDMRYQLIGDKVIYADSTKKFIIDMSAGSFEPKEIKVPEQYKEMDFTYYQQLGKVHAIGYKEGYTDPLTFVLADSKLEVSQESILKVNWKKFGFKIDVVANLAVTVLFITIFLLVCGIAFLSIFRKELYRKKEEDKRDLRSIIADSAMPGSKVHLVDDILLSVVEESYENMRRTKNNSSYLLMAGIVSAFLGMVVSYLYFHEMEELRKTTHEDPTLFEYLRPLFILVFMESLSFFFLRQYRNLLIDFKYYYHIYLKRSNYIILSRLLKEGRTDVDNSNLTMLVSDMLEDNGDTNCKAENNSTDLSMLKDIVLKAIDKMG